MMSKSVLTTKISLAVGLILVMIFGSAPVGAFAAVVRSTYIVQVQGGHSVEVRDAISRLGETPHDELTEVMDGFVIDLTDTEVAALRSTQFVSQVVADAPMSLMDTQSPVPSWGLDRIDQTATAGDGAYNYPSSAGAGVRVYVVDTGVMASNPDFTGRILPGVDMMGQNLEAADCQGHGTHVAGTIAGTKYGVAKKALIVPVRVLNCSGSGSWSYFISAMDWIIANNPAGTPAVMSASIGGGSYPLANAAVEKLYAAGITPVIAAGNSNVDACGTSPAGAPDAITVGASEITDARASYSNWGDCVDVFAPGSNIISDSNLDPTVGVSKSGTSMATPHVSGLVALYLSANPSANPATVTAAIKAGGIAGAVANAQSTLGNILINNTFTRASVPVAPAPVNPPTGVTASAISSTAATISWTAPVAAAGVTSTAPDSYKLEYKLAADTVWQAQTTTATSLTLSTLSAMSNYVVRVTSIAGAQSSAPTSELQFSTLGTAPDAPTNLNAVTIYGNQIDLNWSRPNANGASFSGYNLEWLVNGVWVSNSTVVSTSVSVNTSVKNLSPLTSYSFRVKAYNTFGTSLTSNTLTVSTTTATPATPSGIVMSNISGTTATASWKASPQIDPAVAITYEVQILSRQITNFGAVLATYQASTNSFLVTGLRRTTAYSITVKAISGTVSSPVSASVVFTTTATKAVAPAQTKAVKTATGFTISWAYPADDGGSAVTGYQLELQNADGTWSVIGSLANTVLSYSAPAPARATMANYRVAAANAFGLGAYAAISVSTPADLPSAPALTITRGSSSSALNWTAPTDNGGAPVIAYVVYRSADNGVTWVALTSIITLNTYTVGLPAKGIKYLYAVAAKNYSGVGTKSNSVLDETLTTVPGPVRSITFSYPVANKLQISWLAPADLGGLPIVAYRLERQASDGSWSILNESNALSIQIDRDLPGVLVAVRVSAINALGVSAALLSGFRTPYVKASAPQNFAAVDSGTFVTTSWTAPADLGGSAISYYQVLVTKDNGATWIALANSPASLTKYNVPRPAKGQSWTYRAVAYTGYGISEYSTTSTVAAVLTVASAPSLRSLVLGADGTLTGTWLAPSDLGGTALTGYLVERSADNVNWTALPALAANQLTINLPGGGPGARTYLRVKASNSIGNSAASNVAAVMVPYQVASAPSALTATIVNGRAQLSWTAPTFIGGSPISQYSIEYSANGGTTWAVFAYSASTAASVGIAAKGQTFNYRVSARNAAGVSASSNVASATTPVTVASSVRLNSAISTGVGTFNLTFSTPSDLGGYAAYGYRVEVLVGGVWNSVATGTGSATNVVAIVAPSSKFVYSYRVYATNPTGDSAAAYFNYRG